MTLDDAILLARSEVDTATKKFPTWPTRAIDASQVLNEEAGELSKEVLQLTYEPHKSSREDVMKEAIQTAAMSLRFLMSLEEYDYTPAPQHAQSAD